jgi:deoxyribodipyrimidine photolyase-like uncharacterized protein
MPWRIVAREHARRFSTLHWHFGTHLRGRFADNAGMRPVLGSCDRMAEAVHRALPAKAEPVLATPDAQDAAA